MAEAFNCSQELAFFGKVTAGVTHEMKNYLALINEYNGLISDLIMAHELGRDLDLGRLQSLSGDIKRQVAAGGNVLDHLNAFAHSLDQPSQTVDLGRYLELFVALSRRSAVRQGVELGLEPLARALSLRTRPFLLLRGLWQCLEAALDGCAAGGQLTLRAGLEQGQVQITLAGQPVPGGQAAPAAELLAALGACFSRRESGELLLCLPLERP